MNKKLLQSLPEFSLWVLNPFLIVLLVFEQQIEIGTLLQWMGNLHPLLLHFPIVFGLLVCVYYLFSSRKRLLPETEKLLISLNAFLAVIVAILGFFLAISGEYQGDIFNQHKLGGVAISFLSWILLLALNWKVLIKKTLSVVFIVVLIIGTHRGAQLTHGVHALSFPFAEIFTEGENNNVDSTMSIYQIAVQPILEQKCVSCHGPEKQRGSLRLDTPEHISEGGESGDILGPGSIIVARIHMPLEKDGHMPPEGKVQLTKEEIRVLDEWVNQGADFTQAFIQLSKESSLFTALNEYLSSINEENVEVGNLPDLEEFNTDYCTVNYLYNGSGEVEVNFFQASFYDRKVLNKLLKIKEYIIQLNLQTMPLEKKDLDVVLQFENLEKLNLNSTGVNIGDLKTLKKLQSLRSISINGIDFTADELDVFLTGSNFTSINMWSDNLNEKELKDIFKKYPGIQFTVGDNMKDEIIKINQPLIAQDSQIIRNSLEVRLYHLLNEVNIYYTTDGTKPDSMSEKYEKPMLLTETTTLKARAFKSGWIGSDVVEQSFFKSAIRPDTLYLLTDPHPDYTARGAGTLTDMVLGQTNFQNGQWLAWKENDMEFMIGFDSPHEIKSLQLNALTRVNQQIFPVKSILAEGSSDGNSFERIAEVSFPDVDQKSEVKAKLYGIEFPDGKKFSHYRITVKNVKEMPQWHRAKGKPALVFIDEIFLN